MLSLEDFEQKVVMSGRVFASGPFKFELVQIDEGLMRLQINWDDGGSLSTDVLNLSDAFDQLRYMI